MCFLNIFDMKTLYIQNHLWERTTINKIDSRKCLDYNKPGKLNQQKEYKYIILKLYMYV